MNWKEQIEQILQIDLIADQGLSDIKEASLRSDNLISALSKSLLIKSDLKMLERFISPQWIVLAAGKGSRIDPSGKINKNLDIYFGSNNVIQLSRCNLIGNRPHIVVVNSDMLKRIQRILKKNREQGSTNDGIDLDEQNRLFGERATLVLQPIADGTGGALKAAVALLNSNLKEFDSEFVGVAFGDEPFLDKSLFVQTFIDHLTKMSDITLCGKLPESTEGRGGLFFDQNGKFMGTKEWKEMSKFEQELMQRKLSQGEAYTNTGITFIRRELALERLERLSRHPNGEFHHVDLIKIFYEDQLATNAYIYRGEVPAGVNSWENVRAGEKRLYSRWRNTLVDLGVKVDPKSQVSLAIGGPKLKPNFLIGQNCHILGKCHIGYGVEIGDHCRLENATLLRNVKVGKGVLIKDVKASSIVIPNDVKIESRTLGLARDINADLPRLHLEAVVSPDYKAGIFKFGEKRGLVDWERLRKHILNHAANELIPRSTQDSESQRRALQAVEDLLNLKRHEAEAYESYIFDDLTPEEIWEVIYQIVEICSKNPDPYKFEKSRSESIALKLLKKFEADKSKILSWEYKVKISIAANVIDYSSNAVLERLKKDINYFEGALESALECQLSIDDSRRFKDMLINCNNSKRIVWLTDNSGEVVFDLWLIEHLVGLGHKVTIAAKARPVSNDATSNDVENLLNSERFESLKPKGVKIIASGSTTVGTDLHQASPEFIDSLLNSDLVISKGQGNWYTTQGLLKDRFYLLMSKGMTSELSTGIVANKNKLIDGMILAFVPAGARIEGSLKDFVERNR